MGEESVKGDFKREFWSFGKLKYKWIAELPILASLFPHL